MFTLNRAFPTRKYELSQDPCCRRICDSRRSLLIRFRAKISVWNGVRLSMSGVTLTFANCPDASTCNGRSTEMLRSDTLSDESSIVVSM